MSNKSRTVLLCIISAVWVVNMLAPVVLAAAGRPAFKPPEELNAVFTMVVGYLVATYDRNKTDRPKGKPGATIDRDDEKSDGGDSE